MIECGALEFRTHGAQLFRAALKPSMAALEAALAQLPRDEAGVRVHGLRGLESLLSSDGCIGAIAETVLGTGARPVRALFFNKTAAKNWSLAWHQDRTIPVKDRRDAPGFGPWTIKRGMHHVAPPSDLLARMVTLRAHLDDVPATNAPLLVAPGSHAFGRIHESKIDEIVRRCGTATCIATAGDVWLYATPLLHASEAATEPTSRRVLQVDFAAEPLPHGLEWLGV
jgi:hypothetical protein